MTAPITARIATVTLNPAIDQTASIPNFEAGEVNRVAWEQADPGGKGVNVASFLADFGFSVSVTGLLGRDNPELFQRLFEQKGIRDRFIRIAGKTRVNVKIVDDIQQQVTDVNFPGQSPSPTDLQDLKEAIAQLTDDHDWFILSGSLPEGVSPDIYQELITFLKNKGKSVALDASGDSFRQAISAAPDLIKPNLFELQQLLGRSLNTEADIIQAARDLIHQGIQHVAVSMGAQGALFVDAQSVVHAQPPAIEVKSTVGAGDAMVAGTITAIIRGYPLPDCARLATAFSMGALSQIGPRLPPPETVQTDRDRVTIRQLN